MRTEESLVYSPEDLKSLDPRLVPRHVAIIMDGNRRWARGHSLSPIMGHWKGADALTNIVTAAKSLGIKVLTVFSFSTENWTRPEDEVEGLMDLFKNYLLQQKQAMIQEGIKLDAIGDLSRLPPEVRETVEECKRATAHCDQIELVLAMNYGGRNDILQAARLLAKDAAEGKLKDVEISEKTFSDYLDTAKWEDPALLIRTSGENRISNFLLWQLSYAEVYISDVLWPDFSEGDLLEAVIEYQKRGRRWGA